MTLNDRDVEQALLSVVRRLTADAAAESLYGELEFSSDDDARLLDLPIAFDPRFDLDPTAAPLVIDLVESRLRRTLGASLDLKKEIARQHFRSDLEDAETIGDYLRVLKACVRRRSRA